MQVNADVDLVRLNSSPVYLQTEKEQKRETLNRGHGQQVASGGGKKGGQRRDSRPP